MDISYYAELPPEPAKMTGLLVPNTTCLRLGFLEAEPEKRIWAHVIYRGRALRRTGERKIG